MPRKRPTPPVETPKPVTPDSPWPTPEARAARQHKHTQQLLRVCEQQYERSRNPVFAWDAILIAHERSLPLPPWVLAYLVGAATQIGELSRSPLPRTTELPRAVYRALGFAPTRRVNPFTTRADEWHSRSIALMVYAAMEGSEKADGTEKSDAAIDAVVQSHSAHCTREPKCKTISRATVARAWRQHRAAIQSLDAPPIE